MKAAVVVTTYNNPRTLGICLKSLTNQTCRDFDVFIADDGSKEETRAKIERLRTLFSCRVEHFWHPDTGYRKSVINNEVFRQLADYPVTICVDHDVIAERHFIEDHLAIHQRYPNACFMGRRVDLGPWISARITEENVTQFNQGFSTMLLLSALKGETKSPMRAFRISSPYLQQFLKRDRVPDLLGSNFSVATRLLYQVNGYNEDYKSYWGEDGDLFIRVRNSGAKLVGLKGFAVQYHLDHPRLEPDAESQARYQSLLQDRSYQWCSNGITKDK